MKIFVYEHITSGALCEQNLPESLAKEGEMMLMAILNDLKTVSGIELIILRDARIVQHNFTGWNIDQYCNVSDQNDFDRRLTQCINKADAVLAIAPETNGGLATIQQKIIDMNKIVLGCHPDAIRIATDKLLSAEKMAEAGLAYPTTILATDWLTAGFISKDGYIIKPRDGAGCTDTLYFQDNQALKEWLVDKTADDLDFLLVQNYIKGTPASLSILITDHDISVLATNRQLITIEGQQLVFSGCIVNDIDHKLLTITQAQAIAETICKLIPGLWGFIGIDIILRQSDQVIIDINPRLTTSYVGLHASIATNPAELLLKGNGTLPDITTREPIKVCI